MVHGNPEVVKLLENWLSIAKAGNFNFCALTLCELVSDNAAVALDYAGSIELQAQAVAGLSALRDMIEAEVINRSPPPHDSTLGADYVSYNLAGAPVSWDFLPWLIDAEMTRIREGAPFPLKVAFLNGLDGSLDAGSDYRRGMLANVVRPLLRIIGAVEDPKAARGRHKKMYTMRDITAAARAGETVPRLRNPYPMGYPPSYPITITLREATHWSHRNSNLPAWLQFANDLKGKGEDVIFVRDTAKANESLHEFQICPEASVHIDKRLGLYERAKCNLFVMNGPTSLAWFGTRPWLAFVELHEGSGYDPDRPGWWKKAHGIEDGGQLPWSYSDQRLIWKSDTYENIRSAWEELNENQALG